MVGMEIQKGETLGQRIQSYYEKHGESKTKAREKAFSLLAQMTKAGRGILGFDVDAVQEGDFFKFDGNKVTILYNNKEKKGGKERSGSKTIELDLNGETGHIIEQSRQALEGTRVDLANQWIDRKILSNVALAAVGIENWNKGRDAFVNGLLKKGPSIVMVPGEAPVSLGELLAKLKAPKYSKEYNIVILSYLEEVKASGYSMRKLWAELRSEVPLAVRKEFGAEKTESLSVESVVQPEVVESERLPITDPATPAEEVYNLTLEITDAQKELESKYPGVKIGMEDASFGRKEVVLILGTETKRFKINPSNKEAVKGEVMEKAQNLVENYLKIESNIPQSELMTALKVYPGFITRMVAKFNLAKGAKLGINKIEPMNAGEQPYYDFISPVKDATVRIQAFDLATAMQNYAVDYLS
ncbi:MAG: hypothetical protein UW70_C0068G0008 [Candidatus Peregrinibacteria bacterium GW2011_GWA2_44_7]|nr:MAG: hypothetical protein UW70_C0068G0008 [Candidatus Peregrinibacteria bacterium GW2011_GWA2_44_7]